MFDKAQNDLGRRAWLAAVVTLLALCAILLGSQTTAAGQGPFTQQPAFDRMEIAGPAGLAMETGPGSACGLQQSINPGFTVDLTYNALWGLVDPGDTVIVNRTDGAYGAAEADGVGFFWTYLWYADGRSADIAGGDTLEVYVNGALVATLSPLAIIGEVDVLADQVTGNVSGLGAGTVVTATLGEGYMFADEPYATAAVDGSGDFVADFTGIADIGPYMFAQVQYRDGNGHTVQGTVYPFEVFRVNNWNSVERYAQFRMPVTVTIYTTYPGDPRWSATTFTEWPHGSYVVNASDHGESIEYGDVVEVDLGGGVVINVTADYLDIQPDAATDQITGIAPAGETVRGYLWDTLVGYSEDSDVADGGGNYTLDLGLDLETWHWLYVGYADGDGDEVGVGAQPAHIRAYPPLGNLLAIADGPEQPVTYTLDTGTETFTQYGWCGAANRCDTVIFDAVEPGYVITAELPDLTMVMTVASFSLNRDTPNDQVYGSVDTPGWMGVYAYQWYEHLYPAHGWAVAAADVNPPSYAVPFPGFDIRDGMALLWGVLCDAEGHRTFNIKWQQDMAFFEVEPPISVEGVPPNADEVVTATLYAADGVELASTSHDHDDDPWHFTLDFLGSGIDILPSHWLTVTSESGWQAGLQVPTLTVQTDVDADLIWGEGPKAQVMVEHHGNGRGANQWVPVDGYVLDRAYFGGDIETGDTIEVLYQAPIGDRVRIRLLWPWMYVNYGEDEVGGAYDVGHTFWITVTDSGGTPRATATANTEPAGSGPDGTWEHGFTVAGGDWSPSEPDIQPGDWVHFRSDDGYNNSVRVGTITGGINAEADTASGAIEVPGLASQTVDVIVGGWGFPGFEIDTVDLDAAGRGEYSVDFSPTDLPPDISLGVNYVESDRDRVYNNIFVVWEVYLPIVIKNYAP